ncbi:MAG: hypothetical protein LC794_14015 [Acidobacteria bacterium]|nr:hypothetical protein [Acidobacteriota bacterium]MCA1627790.1 hypothetical protein [Acidobacteriota bacterium]
MTTKEFNLTETLPSDYHGLRRVIRISKISKRPIRGKLRVVVVALVVGMIPLRVVGIVPVVAIVPVRVVEIVPLFVVDMTPLFGNTAVERIKTKRVEQTIDFIVFIAFSCAEASKFGSTQELVKKAFLGPIRIY